MTEAEIRAALQKRGWTYHPRKRRERLFVYSSRRNGKQVEEYRQRRYFCKGRSFNRGGSRAGLFSSSGTTYERPSMGPV